MMAVDLNTLPPLGEGDPNVQQKAAPGIVPQEQPATPGPENVKDVPTPAEQEQAPVASVPDVPIIPLSRPNRSRGRNHA